jgi:response regulator RpfG family c-di-GMP phosphodiesterase
MHGDDELMFEDDMDDGQPGTRITSGWKMLIVDDEPEVHSITKLVLSDFVYKGRPAEFLSAYSADEARRLLAEVNDIAVILLDVVMETDDAGLQLVRHIREVLKNRHVRIILRTGQPGQAPERSVILEYDINDYKAKTQLTAQQLFTTTVAALRSYEDMTAIEANRRGLEKIIEASSSLFVARSMKLFAAGVLTQLSGLLGVPEEALVCVQRGPAYDHVGAGEDELYLLAASGPLEKRINEPAVEHLDPFTMAAVLDCLDARANIFEPDFSAFYMPTSGGAREVIVVLRSSRPLSPLDRDLVELFCDKISVGFANLHAFEQLRRAHEGTAAMLADLADRRAHEPPDPTLRIGDLSERIARRMRANGDRIDEMDETFIDAIGLATILHDVGNAHIDPAVLGKPGELTEEERRHVETHPISGAALLNRAAKISANSSYLRMAGDIALRHHERWDGQGYPDRLAGKAIPLAARIAAVADCYDAMTRERPWRAPLSHAAAVAEIAGGAGAQFDPLAVKAFLGIADRLIDD